MAATAARRLSRTEKREVRRQQLIDATIACISRAGIGGTKLGDVAREAGLSQGIVNLHFASKDNLLAATLQYLADEYRARFDAVLEQSGTDAAEQLLALMEMDFAPGICDRPKLAVWFAFWGEVQSVPTYQKICEERDRYYSKVFTSLCQRIIEDGRYRGLDAATVANALSSMTDGLWLSCLISPKSFNRDEAMDAVYGYLRAVFPEHYE